MENRVEDMEGIEKIGQKQMSPEAQKAAEEKAEAWRESMEDAPAFLGEEKENEDLVSAEIPNQIMSEQTKDVELASIKERIGSAYIEQPEEASSEKMENVNNGNPLVARLYDYRNYWRGMKSEKTTEMGDAEMEKFDGVDIPQDFIGEEMVEKAKKPHPLNFFERIKQRREEEHPKFAPSTQIDETFNRLDKMPLGAQEKIYASENCYKLANLAVASAGNDSPYHRPDDNALPHLYKVVAGMSTRMKDPSTPNTEKAKLKSLIGESEKPEDMIERLLEGERASAETTEILINADRENNYGSQAVRDDISEFAFGDKLGDIGKDLVSLGIIKLDMDTRKQNIPFGTDSYLYPREHNLSELVNLDEEGLTRLNCSEKEAGLIRDAINLMNVEPSNSKLDQEFNKFKELLAKEPDTPILSESLQRLKQDALFDAGKNFKEAMQEDLKNAKNIGNVNYDGKEIDVLSYGDNPYRLLVHRLGAYSEKDESNPAQWNEYEPDAFDENGNPVGYIATSTLTDKNFHLAIDKSEVSNPEEVFYGFTDFKDDSVKAMSEYDLYTEDDSESKDNLATMRQGIIYRTFDELIKETENWHQNFEQLNHNEVDLNRYNGDKDIHGGRIQPNYIISFQKDLSDISDTVKKHAAYFNVPIIMIDPEKYQ